MSTTLLSHLTPTHTADTGISISVWTVISAAPRHYNVQHCQGKGRGGGRGSPAAMPSTLADTPSAPSPQPPSRQRSDADSGSCGLNGFRERPVCLYSYVRFDRIARTVTGSAAVHEKMTMPLPSTKDEWILACI